MTVVKMETLAAIIQSGEFHPMYDEHGLFQTLQTADGKYKYTVKDFIELNKYLREEMIFISKVKQ